MGDTSGRKIAHFLKRITRHRKKSSTKHEKAVEWYILILKKEVKFGHENKRVIRTKEKAILRLKKLGIPTTKVKEVLERRGYKDLLSKVNY